MSADVISLRSSATAAAAAVALPCLVPSRVLGRGGRPGANETVRIGVIGCGGRARTLVNEAKGVKGFRVAAACDCFRPRLVPYLKETAADLPIYEDFRGHDREGKARRRDGRNDDARRAG